MAVVQFLQNRNLKIVVLTLVVWFGTFNAVLLELYGLFFASYTGRSPLGLFPLLVFVLFFAFGRFKNFFNDANLFLWAFFLAFFSYYIWLVNDSPWGGTVLYFFLFSCPASAIVCLFFADGTFSKLLQNLNVVFGVTAVSLIFYLLFLAVYVENPGELYHRLSLTNLNANSFAKNIIFVLAISTLLLFEEGIHAKMRWVYRLNLALLAFITLCTISVGVVLAAVAAAFIVFLISIYFNKIEAWQYKKITRETMTVGTLLLLLDILISFLNKKMVTVQFCQRMVEIFDLEHPRSAVSARLQAFEGADSLNLYGSKSLDFGALKTPHNIFLEMYYLGGIGLVFILGFFIIFTFSFYLNRWRVGAKTGSIFVFIFLCHFFWALIGGELLTQYILISFIILSIVKAKRKLKHERHNFW